MRLTQMSKSSGCGCKIAPALLDEILRYRHESDQHPSQFPNLVVGNQSNDDAAAYDLQNGEYLLSTTDFFTPIVDNPFHFGQIAAANALSDIYAMGGKPIMALAILGWNTDQLSTQTASEVLLGARAICSQAGIPLAGGHSINSTEPIFGLSVNGLLKANELKRNNTAKVGDVLFVTKPLGVGIMATALKREKLKPEDYQQLIDTTTMLNTIGLELAKKQYVTAMTDVTGFGLLGHLIEMCENNKNIENPIQNMAAQLNNADVPLLDGLHFYTSQYILPDNTYRNWNGYGHKVSGIEGVEFMTLCDPQTSGGLLVAIASQHVGDYIALCKAHNLPECASKPIGKMIEGNAQTKVFVVNQ